MLSQREIELIAEEIVRQFNAQNVSSPAPFNPNKPVDDPAFPGFNTCGCVDIDSPECKAIPILKEASDYDALERMKKKTTARIGVGKCGARMNTQTMLTLRADHAKARDSVFADVSSELISKMNLLPLQTKCKDRDEHITRPDLGRLLSDESQKKLLESCTKNPQIQIVVGDGLSSAAIEANIERILPVLKEGLERKGLKVGKDVFVKFGRVGVEDHIAELLGAEVVCMFVGERPGLATAESMSAYLVYNAKVGIPESKRTVVSNIHKDGLNAVEAGAYIAEVLEQILQQKKSGVDLVK